MEMLKNIALVILLVLVGFMLGQSSAGKGCAGGCQCGDKWVEQGKRNGQYTRHIIQSGGRIISPNPNIGASK